MFKEILKAIIAVIIYVLVRIIAAKITNTKSNELELLVGVLVISRILELVDKAFDD